MHDPGLQSLRRAARVGIVVPVIFAIFLEGVDNPVASMFAAFGSFALLGFADFGGAARPRGIAYLTLTVVGAVLVLVGTLVCNEPVLAALVAVLVATAARFAGCFGGYFGASVSPVILAYVLAATVPAPMDAIPDRLLGWLVAGVAATVAGLVLWPRRERLVLREAAAAAAAALADAIDQLGTDAGPAPELMAKVDTTLATLVETASVPRRPDGPSAHDASLAFLVDQLGRLGLLTHAAAERGSVNERCTELMAISARGLRGIEHMLRTGAVGTDLDDLVAACIHAKRDALDRAVGDLGEGRDAGEVLDEIDGLFAERMVLLITASALANAAVVVSGRGPSEQAVTIPLEVPFGDRVHGTFGRLRLLVQANAHTTSAWAQESLRAGISVAAAVLIAGELRLDHGFWVVLGTLSVLRSNAFDTGRTALMASLGTAVGFAISAAWLAVVGFHHDALWVSVAVGFFLSAYTPQVVGFVVGQICFTITVVAMFNLIIPQGWHTGLVRFENILIGSSVSAVVALLFWPRRASVGLRANVADLYRSLARALTADIGTPDATDPVRAAELRAHASYVAYLSETNRAPKGRRPWATLLAEAAQARFAIDGFADHRGVTRFDDCGPTRQALDGTARDVASALNETATRLERKPVGTTTPLDIPSVTAATRVPVRACLEHHAHEQGPDGPLAAGLDAAIVRDLLLEVAVIADASREIAPTTPSG